MREILFRGKDVSGNWHYGVPLTFTDDCVCITAPHTHNKTVIPSTIGQHTGLTDKNGKRIFEGDIVKTKKYGKIIERSNVNGCDIFKVVYEPAVFRLENVHRGFNLVGNSADYEVVGNIYDNPEQFGIVEQLKGE